MGVEGPELVRRVDLHLGDLMTACFYPRRVFFCFCIRYRTNYFFRLMSRPRTTARRCCRRRRRRRQLWFRSRRVGRDASRDADERRAFSGNGAQGQAGASADQG